MIKGTRFFSRRLLPLLLAAVMLLGMLPALTLPVLAEDPPASQKLTNTTDTEVTYQGAVGTGRAPSLVVDGDTSHNDNKYFVVGNDQTQEKMKRIRRIQPIGFSWISARNTDLPK